jgi:hypothetical protein
MMMKKKKLIFGEHQEVNLWRALTIIIISSQTEGAGIGDYSPF